MKRLYPLGAIVLCISVACGAVSSATPAQVATVPPASAIPPTLPATEAPSTPRALAGEIATNSPPAPVLQPAVAHHQAGDPIILDSITMIDALNGWAFSGRDVLFTADGAQTWREATPPDISSGTVVQPQGVFLDSDHAWIIYSPDRQIPSDAVVWRTTDSGRTWSASAPLNHEAYGDLVWAEFFALDATDLWLMVRGVYAGAGTHYAAQFMRSTDGGLTWSPQAGDVGVDYTGLAFADREHGLLTWQTTGAYAPSPPEYALTSDGGLHWEVRQLPPPADVPDVFETSPYCEPFRPRLLSAHSIRILVGCFDFHDPPQAFSSYLYASEDGGSTWTSTRLPENVLANVYWLFFFDQDHGLLLGRDIYRSTDGGQSWQHVKSVTWDGWFSFVDPQTGWAIARADNETALVKTSNGGAAWVEIKPVIAP